MRVCMYVCVYVCVCKAILTQKHISLIPPGCRKSFGTCRSGIVGGGRLEARHDVVLEGPGGAPLHHPGTGRQVIGRLDGRIVRHVYLLALLRLLLVSLAYAPCLGA